MSSSSSPPSSPGGGGPGEPDEPPSAPPPPAQALGAAVALAQVCHFCATFRRPLRLRAFSRTELQDALIHASSGLPEHMELLAELHYKLAREQYTTKMDRMLQDWEKAVARKLAEHWRLEFEANPMAYASYSELTVDDRVRILDALCHWKLDSCSELHKFVMGALKENDDKAINALRGDSIGTDDRGTSYWYFDDGCWVYAEDKPSWQLSERKPAYSVEFASAKRIRLSINFQEEDSLALLEKIPAERKAKVSFDLTSKEESSSSGRTLKVEPAVDVEMKQEKQETQEKMDSEAPPAPNTGPHALKALLNEDVKVGVDTREEQQPVVKATLTIVEDAEPFKPQSPPAVVPPPAIATSRKMDISMLCASSSPSSDDGDAKQETFEKVVEIKRDAAHADLQPNGQATADSVTTIKAAPVPHAAVAMAIPSDDGDVIMDTKVEPDAVDSCEASTAPPAVEPPVVISEERGGGSEPSKATASRENDSHSQSLPRLGSKKRMIVDDDTTNSSSESGSDAAAEKKQKRSTKKQRSSSDPAADTTEARSPPAKKRRRVSVSPQAVDKAIEPTSEQPVSESNPAAAAPPAVNGVVANGSGPTAAAAAAAADSESVKLDDPTASTDSFEVTCASCTKLYDMRYLDPPLVERPVGEWRCFECLVNDARGWPRRRKSISRGSHSKSDAHDERSSGKTRRRSSSSKPRSSSSSSKKRSSTSTSKSSKNRSSSRSKSSSSSKHKKSSSSHSSTSAKKSSSASSSRKHKRKSSSASSHHHSSSSHHYSSSSHHHKSRRHHRHSPEQFSKLVDAFQARKSQRRALEDARMRDEGRSAYLEGPSGWRVASSTLDELRQLVASLSGGSLEQDRLRGRLIMIAKEQEKAEEHRRKQQELAWSILPRRQSSRIAISKIKTQTSRESELDDESGEDETGAPRSTRSRGGEADESADNKQRLAIDRASRLRRRHRQLGSESESEEEDREDAQLRPGDWIKWSLLEKNQRSLSTLCLALVKRLLREAIAELFARPVDPELDGCPDYLTVIKHPMDLGTIRSRLQSQFYSDWGAFKRDVELVWHNCRLFNDPDSVVVEYAEALEQLARAMCAAAERRGAAAMQDADRKGVGRSESDPKNCSARRKAETIAGDADDDTGHASSSSDDASVAGSANKAWTESSASEASVSSDESASSEAGSSGSGGGSTRRKRKPVRVSTGRTPTTAWPSRSRRGGATSAVVEREPPKANRAAKFTRTPARTRRRALKSSDDDDDDDSSSFESESDDDATSRTRKRRPATRNTRTAAPPAPAARRSEGIVAPARGRVDVVAADALASARSPPTKPRASRARVIDSSSSEASDASNAASSSSSSSASSSSSDSEASSDGEMPRRKKAPTPRKPPLHNTAGNSSEASAASHRSPPPPSSPPPPPPPPSAATTLASKLRDSPPPPPPSASKDKLAARASRATGKPGSLAAAAAPTPSLLHSYLSSSSSSSSGFSSSSDSDSNADAADSASSDDNN